MQKSSVWQTFVKQQRQTGNSNLIVAILSIIDQLLKSLSELSKEREELLMSSLEVIFTEILPVHLSWKYETMSMRVSLSVALLGICATCYGLPPSRAANQIVKRAFNMDERLCRTVLSLCCVDRKVFQIFEE